MEEPLFVSTEGDVTLAVNVVLEQKYVNIINTRHHVESVLHICIANIIDKNIIVGNVFQKNFVFTTKELVNVIYAHGTIKRNNTTSELYYI